MCGLAQRNPFAMFLWLKAVIIKNYEFVLLK